MNRDRFEGTWHEFKGKNRESDQDRWNREEKRGFKNQDMYKGQDREYGKSERENKDYKNKEDRSGRDRDENNRDKKRKAG